MDKKDILQLITKSVKETDPRATLILHGSHARGDNNADSDIDILILIDKDKITHEDRVKFSHPLYDIQFDLGIIISPMVFSRQQWNNKNMITPFYENVTKEGIIL